jgi:hypothetical protein
MLSIAAFAFGVSWCDAVHARTTDDHGLRAALAPIQ